MFRRPVICDQLPTVMVPSSTASTSSNPYLNPALAEYLDSFEGITWPQPAEQPQERAARGPARSTLHAAFESLGVLSPGVVLALLLAAAAKWLAPWLGANVFRQPDPSKSPVSEILLAILLGIIIRNTIGLPGVYESGLRLCLKRVLRIGIALLGLRLTLMGLAQVWQLAAPIVVICIASAILVVAWISRMLGLPRRLGTLIGVGTSICGVSAIVATAPVIDADDDEVSYAVACITLFGLMTLFVYPFLAHWIFHADAKQVGVFLGTAVHDTSQVTGAALMYKQMYSADAALSNATATKLLRNVFMAAVIPLMAISYHRGSKDRTRQAAAAWHQAIPLFVIVFIALAAARSIGDYMLSRSVGAFWIFPKDTWLHWFAAPGGKSIADRAAVWCLTIALAAVGLGTSLKKLRVLGLRPLCAGFAAAAIVGAVSIGLIKLLAR
jgi:uncharacterized integral membrane protein (TIGR00698 family)